MYASLARCYGTLSTQVCGDIRQYSWLRLFIGPISEVFDISSLSDTRGRSSSDTHAPFSYKGKKGRCEVDVRARIMRWPPVGAGPVVFEVPLAIFRLDGADF